MKEELMHLVNSLKEEQNIDLKETPALFRWAYKEDPFIMYEMLIKETEQANLEFIPIDEGEVALH